MYESLCVDVKVERGFNFCVHTQPFISFASISFTHVKITRHWKSTLTQKIVLIKANDTRKSNLFISRNSLGDFLFDGIKMKEKSLFTHLKTSASKFSVNGRNTNASRTDIAATNDARNKGVQNIYKSSYFKPCFQRESRWTSSHT